MSVLHCLLIRKVSKHPARLQAQGERDCKPKANGGYESDR
jgi:hypothetical protein